MPSPQERTFEERITHEEQFYNDGKVLAKKVRQLPLFANLTERNEIHLAQYYALYAIIREKIESPTAGNKAYAASDSAGLDANLMYQGYIIHELINAVAKEKHDANIATQVSNTLIEECSQHYQALQAERKGQSHDR